MLKKKYYDGFTVHDILNKHLDDGHKILELLTAFADADGVDAVEVVRCKDCKHMGDVYLVRLPWLEQKEHRCRYWEHPTMPDDYCSMAEREEE